MSSTHSLFVGAIMAECNIQIEKVALCSRNFAFYNLMIISFISSRLSLASSRQSLADSRKSLSGSRQSLAGSRQSLAGSRSHLASPVAEKSEQFDMPSQIPKRASFVEVNER